MSDDSKKSRCTCGSQDMTGKVLTCVGGEGFHSREKCDPAPEAPSPQGRCPACNATGKRPVYSAGEEMVADFKPCGACGGTGLAASRGDK